MTASSRQTQPLWTPCPSRSAGERIPRLGGGQGFKILAQEWESAGLTVYRAYGLDPVRICPECSHYNPPSSANCQVCNHPLDGVQDAPAVVFLYESCDIKRLAPFLYFPQKQITHPHLLAPYTAQALKSRDGVHRYQLFVPERPAPALKEQKAPASLADVLNWGVQLAQALTVLHASAYPHGVIDAQHVLVRNHRAWLLAAPGVQSPPLSPTISDDVRDLAATLMQALGLPATPQGVEALPAAVQKAFAPALNRTLPEPNSADLFRQLLRYARESLHKEKGRRLAIAWATDDGRQRTHNEDSLLVMHLESTRESLPANGGVFLVADGAGGHEAGEIASKTAVQVIGQALTPALATFLLEDANSAGEEMEARVRDAILAANQRIRKLQQERANNMLTTVAMALIVRDRAILAHVGDSRIYLWREGRLQQLTTDHTTVQQLIAMGQISPEQARSHPRRHELYRALGHKENPQPDISAFPLQSDDLLLLCSDGLYEELPDDAIAATLQNAPSLSEAARTLIRAANDAGGSDNISVILVRVVGGESRV